MGTRARSIALGLLVLGLLGFGLHQFLTSLTASRRVQSVQKLETQLRVLLPDNPVESNSADTPVSAPEADYASTAARWQALFSLMGETKPQGDFLDRWHDAIRLPLQVRWGDKEYDGLSEDELALLAAFIQEVDDILRQIRELSQPGTPICYFYSRKEPNLYPECELYLSADLLLATNTGDYTRAVEDIIALTQMCDAYAYIDYPFRMHHGTQQCLRDALASGAVEEAQWDSLLVQLKESRDHAIFADAWARVAQHQLEWYADLPYSERPATTAMGRARQQVFLYGYTYAAAPLINHEVARFGEAMSELLPLAELPYYEARPELERIRTRHNILPPWELPRWAGPASWNLSRLVHEHFGDQAGVEAEIDLARMAILLERYRNEHGNYPETLDTIGSGLGGGIPLNPFLGEPYHYEPANETFRLWYEDIGATTEGGPDGQRAYIWPGQRESIGAGRTSSDP